MSASRAPALGRRIALVALGAAVLAGFLAFDPRAESAFDLPKRCVTLVAVVVAAAALLLTSAPIGLGRWRALPGPLRAAATLAVGFVLATTVAALASAHRPAALEALRTMALYAILVPLGASSALDGSGGRRLLGVYVTTASASAALAVCQAAGLWQPVTVEALGGRIAAFALLGNEGVLALALAFAALGALGALVFAQTGQGRAAAGVVLAVLVAGLAVTRNLTGLLALAVGGLALGLAVLWRRSRRVLVGLALAGSALLILLPLVSGRLDEIVHGLRQGRLDSLLSGRLAPWSAACEMISERPLTGFGPGTFGAEYAEHRVAAEMRQRRRLLNPWLKGGFVEAHSEPLQAAAEVGVPAALALLAALGALVWGALPVLSGPAPDRQEAAVLLALLAAGIAASLLWFPLQRPVTAQPLLLAAGRLWRLGCRRPG